MEVLGFWKKLFTRCVSVVSYQTLSDTIEVLNKNVALKEKVISDLKVELGSKEERIKNYIFNVNDNENKITEVTFKYDSTVKELSNTKDKLEVTLKLLSDAQGELTTTKRQLENRPVVTEVCDCKDETSNVDEEGECLPITPSNKDEEVVGEEEAISDDTFKKEDVLEGADAVVKTSDKIQNFINSLTKVQMKELKDDVLKGHKNDKRLTITLKNWIKKFPDNLETQVYFMFKTALTRRRGKQQLGVWYSKYDDMTKYTIAQ